ncbi:MAG: hypothetical protein IID61_00500 [SAR324 cluster bacterium]|nr:hypothetical protein [SAR324 cluster bacterium]
MKLKKHYFALLALGTVCIVLWCQSLSAAAHHIPAHAAAAPHHESHPTPVAPTPEEGDCPMPDCGRTFTISAHSVTLPAPVELNSSVNLELRATARYYSISHHVVHKFALHENEPPNSSLVQQAVLIRI